MAARCAHAISYGASSVAVLQMSGLSDGEGEPFSSSCSFNNALHTSRRCRLGGTYSTVAVSKMAKAYYVYSGAFSRGSALCCCRGSFCAEA